MTKYFRIHLILQPLMAIVFVCIALYCFRIVSSSTILWAVGAGALSSSCYIVFGRPNCNPAKPINIIGGYLIGILCGEAVRLLLLSLNIYGGDFFTAIHFHYMGMLASISVGLCLYIMALLKLEHPPAAGMALVLVLDLHDYIVLFIIMGAAFVLAGIRKVLGDRLVSLI